VQGGNQERADLELTEKKVIEKYLPEQMDEDQLKGIIDKVIKDLGVSDPKAMGQVIGAVKQQTAGQADGGTIARLVKERLSQ